MHAARRCATPEIVARQVDQHHVLGILLRIGEQFRFERSILQRIRTARPRAGNGTHLGRTAVQLHERFGRRADDDAFAKLAVIHIGRWIQQSQRPVSLERVEIATAGEAHRQDQLVHVAGRDVLLGARYVVQERFLRKAGLGRAELRLPGGTGQAAAQRANDLAAQRRALVLRAGVQQRGPARQVIEDQQ